MDGSPRPVLEAGGTTLTGQDYLILMVALAFSLPHT